MKVQKAKIDKYLTNTSNIFLFILFPGFAIYNVLITYGIIPPVFGGFFGVFNIFYLVAILLPLAFRVDIFKYNNNKNYFLLLLYFFIYIFLYSSLNLLIVREEAIFNAFIQVNQTLLFMLVSFLLGFFIKLNKMLYKLLLYTLLISSCLLLIYTIKTGETMFNTRYLLVDDNVEDFAASYQGLARSALITCLILLGMTVKLRNYIFIYAISVYTLFTLGARSEFIALLFSGALLMLFKFKLNSLKAIYIMLFATIAAIFIGLNLESLYESRVLNIVDLDNDGSWNARKNLQSIGLAQIQNNPILGYFGGHIIDGGGVGSYTHNILSVWAGFGIVPFICYTLLCFIPFIHCFILSIKSKQQSDKFFFCFILAMSVIVLILFSKSFFWFMPAMLFGVYVAINRSDV